VVVGINNDPETAEAQDRRHKRKITESFRFVTEVEAVREPGRSLVAQAALLMSTHAARLRLSPSQASFLAVRATIPKRSFFQFGRSAAPVAGVDRRGNLNLSDVSEGA